jgi:hypothetical protein
MYPFLALFFLAADIAPTSPGLVYSQPQIGSDGQRTGIVFASKDAIYYAEPDSAPVHVADAPSLELGNHRGPRMAFGREAIVITAGLSPPGQPYAPGTLRSWRSTYRGKTWSAGPDISTPGVGGMGFHGIASDGKHQVWAAWIGPNGGHPSLFVSHSEDAGRTWAAQRVLSATVCECCHPTVAVSANGTVHILFRNSVGGNRDFYLATSPYGERFEIAKLGKGSWAVDACPMDGGGMSEFRGDVVTLWRRQGRLFLARPGGQPEEPFAAGRNAAVTLRENGLYAVWSAGDAVMVKAPGKDAWLLSKSGAFPAIAPAGPVVVAWEDAGKIRVARID